MDYVRSSREHRKVSNEYGLMKFTICDGDMPARCHNAQVTIISDAYERLRLSGEAVRGELFLNESCQSFTDVLWSWTFKNVQNLQRCGRGFQAGVNIHTDREVRSMSS